VPDGLAGRLRGDGSLSDTMMERCDAQDRYAAELEDERLVLSPSTMVDGSGVGNMLGSWTTGTLAGRVRAARLAFLGLACAGSGLVLVWKRLEEGAFKWPPIMDGVMRLSPAQLAALIEGLDWKRVHVPEIARPQAVQ